MATMLLKGLLFRDVTVRIRQNLGDNLRWTIIRVEVKCNTSKEALNTDKRDPNNLFASK
jgi:hypothetical protein